MHMTHIHTHIHIEKINDAVFKLLASRAVFIYKSRRLVFMSLTHTHVLEKKLREKNMYYKIQLKYTTILMVLLTIYSNGISSKL